MPVAISNPPKTLPFSRALLSRMKDAVLGKRYELSAVFVSAKEMRRINKTYRGKGDSTDILSFPLSEHSGEIIFCFEDVEREAPLFGRTAANFLKSLFIHGLLHLKGMRHGSRMEQLEARFGKQFGV